MPEPGDQRSPGADDGSLARRFRQHAAALTENGRSPLYAALMTAGAADIDDRGIVAHRSWIAERLHRTVQIGFAVTARAEPDRPEIALARCGDHGPPVTWATERP